MRINRSWFLCQNTIFKIIKNASLDKMKEAVNTVHERSGMSKRKIFNDMLHCTRKYGAG